MSHLNTQILTTTAISILLLCACSPNKEPTFGKRLQGQGAEVQAIGQKWSEGDKIITEGNALVKAGNKEMYKGETLVSKGESKVKKGESMIKKGIRLKAEAEETYKAVPKN